MIQLLNGAHLQTIEIQPNDLRGAIGGGFVVAFDGVVQGAAGIAGIERGAQQSGAVAAGRRAAVDRLIPRYTRTNPQTM